MAGLLLLIIKLMFCSLPAVIWIGEAFVREAAAEENDDAACLDTDEPTLKKRLTLEPLGFEEAVTSLLQVIPRKDKTK